MVFVPHLGGAEKKISLRELIRPTFILHPPHFPNPRNIPALAVLTYGAEQARPLIGLEWKWKQQYCEVLLLDMLWA